MQCKEICLPKYDFRKDLRGWLKIFSRLAVARYILHHLRNYHIIRPLPQTPSRWEACPLPIPHPSRRLQHLDPRCLRCLELGPHFSDQSYAPGWAPGLPPAKSGPEQKQASGTLYPRNNFKTRLQNPVYIKIRRFPTLCSCTIIPD